MNAHDAIRLAETLGAGWMTRQQAAEYARVSVATIDRWRDKGMEYVGGDQEMGRAIRIHRDWLDEWLQAHAHKDGQP